MTRKTLTLFDSALVRPALLEAFKKLDPRVQWRNHELDFGKFHGHTLGEVAAFEPSYVDWLAGNVNRDPSLTMAARVICDELDRRGIRRAHRPARPGWQSNPFR